MPPSVTRSYYLFLASPDLPVFVCFWLFSRVAAALLLLSQTNWCTPETSVISVYVEVPQATVPVS